MTVDIRSGNGDIGTEVAVVQQFITEGVDLILVSPSDAQGIVPVIQQANEAGIPVIEVNSTVGEGAEIVTYVGADDFEFGQMQGELLKQALPEGGKVGYILGHLGVSAQILRKDGLDGRAPGRRRASRSSRSSRPTGTTPRRWPSTQDWLNKYPEGELDAIIDQGPRAPRRPSSRIDNGREEVKFLMGDYPGRREGRHRRPATSTAPSTRTRTRRASTAIDMACLGAHRPDGRGPARPTCYLDLPIVTRRERRRLPAGLGRLIGGLTTDHG